MTTPEKIDTSIDRREAIRRVGFMLGGLTLVGGARLLEAQDPHGRAAAIFDAGTGVGDFTAAEIRFLDEVADTILPPTKTPGAKAAKTGAFMAVMVTDCYYPPDQKIFRDGMRTLDDACVDAYNVRFMQATKKQRLALLEKLDREQKDYMDAIDAARKAKQREAADVIAQASAPTDTASGARQAGAPQVTADSPRHYFRMMKELTLLGYFTSKIGYTQAMRYAETPGRFEPCLPYRKGETSWADHA